MNSSVGCRTASKLPQIEDRKMGSVALIQPILQSSISDIFTQPSGQLLSSFRFNTTSTEDTFRIASELASFFRPGTVVALRGELGAGKTTFVKGIANALGIDADSVSSPTFSYLNIYEAKIPLYHFDMYRLSSKEQFETSGFDEFFFAGGITCIEWPDVALESLPKETIFIDFRHCGENRREIVVS